MAVRQLVLGAVDDHLRERAKLIEKAARDRAGDAPSDEELFARVQLQLLRKDDGPHEQLHLDGEPLIEFAAPRWEFQDGELKMFQYYWTFN